MWRRSVSAHSAVLVTALQILSEKFGVRRQAVFRATPLFLRSVFDVQKRREMPPGRALKNPLFLGLQAALEKQPAEVGRIVGID